MTDKLKYIDMTDSIVPYSVYAGEFSIWLQQLRDGIEEKTGNDVPCDECNACCRSSMFIHIGPDEIDTLIHIPKPLLFAAPGLPKGFKVLGYDEKGQCPMLSGGKCSIYDHRPYTCRTYDCRIFTAAGISLDNEKKAAIADRAQRWQFSYPEDIDSIQHTAIRDAAAFIHGYAEHFPKHLINSSTRVALLAIRVYEIFLPDKNALAERKNGLAVYDIVKRIREAMAEI